MIGYIFVSVVECVFVCDGDNIVGLVMWLCVGFVGVVVGLLSLNMIVLCIFFGW